MFQKLKSLTLRALTVSHTALERFCGAMNQITKLDLSRVDHTDVLVYDPNNSFDGVLRAIAGNMHHLKHLDISFCTAEPNAIESLLPTEDNALNGCPELVYFALIGVKSVDVNLLTKIILALPKLKHLAHKFFIYALLDLTKEEMDIDTARSLFSFNSSITLKQFKNFPPVRYGILAKSPVYQPLKSSSATIDIKKDKLEQKHMANALMALTKFRHIKFWCSTNFYMNMLPVLESIGDNLQNFRFRDKFRCRLSVHDIIKTCSKLVELRLNYCYYKEDVELQENDINQHHVQREQLSKLPVLNCLTVIELTRIDKQMCSADMLIALLQSPCLNSVHITDLEAMSDDVMFNVLSTPGGSALSKVTELSVSECALITAEPFVHWLNKETCTLQYLRFVECEKVDYKLLGAAAEKCSRALIIIELN